MKDKIYGRYIKKEKIELKLKDNTKYIPSNIYLTEQILKEKK